MFISKINVYLEQFKNVDLMETLLPFNEQLHVLEKVYEAKLATTPSLQRLEHAMHPAVSFLIIPIFAVPTQEFSKH